MLDDIDEGARVGVWVTLGIVAFLVFGLLFGLMLRQINLGQAATVMVVAPMTAPALAAGATGLGLTGRAASNGDNADGAKMLDIPISGVVAGSLYFAPASSDLAADAAATLNMIRDVAVAEPGRQLMISGYHDATGDPALNAELAKARALQVRQALIGMGVDPARLVLRKPEQLVGDADADRARRVDVLLMDA
jgi:hypothetical protein